VRAASPVVAAVLAAALAGCTASAAPRPADSTAASRPGALVIGAASTSYAAFASATGVQPAIVEHYASTGAVFSARFAGPAEPLVELQPKWTTLTAVAAGRDDWWLVPYAKAVRAYGRPVILGFAPEANGDWYPWGAGHATPAQYRAAWEHVTSVFRASGAANVTWLWTVNVTQAGHEVDPPARWWPGPVGIRLIGVDGYEYTASQGFAGLFGPVISEIRAFSGLPVLISETGVAPRAGQAAKIPGLFAGASAAGLYGVVYFDLPGNEDWRIDGHPAAIAAFRAAVKEYG